MRTQNSPHSGTKSLRLVVWFLFVLILVSALSLGAKAASMIGSSIFDGKHRFTVFVLDRNKDAAVISLEPQARTVLLRIEGKPTQKEVESSLFIGFDGSIQGVPPIGGESSVSDILASSFFSSGVEFDAMTHYDLLRLYFLSLEEQQDDMITESVILKKGEVVRDASAKFFVDNGILADDKSVAIVNSAGVSGLGFRLEQVIVGLGGGVVSVTTGRDIQDPTHIFYSGEKTYSVERIERLLHQKAEEGNTQAADILVVIGKRSLPLGIFATLEP